jgi:hypothetical protein
MNPWELAGSKWQEQKLHRSEGEIALKEEPGSVQRLSHKAGFVERGRSRRLLFQRRSECSQRFGAQQCTLPANTSDYRAR